MTALMASRSGMSGRLCAMMSLRDIAPACCGLQTGLDDVMTADVEIYDCETFGLLGTVKLQTLGLVVGGSVRGAWRSYMYVECGNLPT